MTARSRMTMRAVLKRDTQANTDYTGAKAPPDYTTLKDSLPCKLYSRKRPMRNAEGNVTATIEELILMVPKGTDIKAGDRVTSVVDRLGRVQHSTTLKVQGPQNKAGWGHIEVTVEDSST